MTRFALLGAAGYIAPRHMKAIRETGGTLVTAYDPKDSVGVLDSHFPDATFFTEFELFDDHIHRLARRGQPIGTVAIATPNHLHSPQMSWALRAGANVICEKPLVIDPQDIDHLQDLERETGKRVSTILQLRLHPAIRALRDRIKSGGRVHDVELTYITARGAWYGQSWKADIARSGGIAANIGVHFFDMLQFVFGERREHALHHAGPTSAAGWLDHAQARVRWFLSINADDLPPEARMKGQRTYRSITVDGEKIEFSDGFADLHTASYAEIAAGRGFGLADSRPAIETLAALREAPIRQSTGDPHPFLERVAA